MDIAILQQIPEALSAAEITRLQTTTSDDLLEEKICLQKPMSRREREKFQRSIGVSVQSEGNLLLVLLNIFFWFLAKQSL